MLHRNSNEVVAAIVVALIVVVAVVAAVVDLYGLKVDAPRDVLDTIIPSFTALGGGEAKRMRWRRLGRSSSDDDVLRSLLVPGAMDKAAFFRITSLQIWYVDDDDDSG